MPLPIDFSPRPTALGIITLNVQVWGRSAQRGQEDGSGRSRGRAWAGVRSTDALSTDALATLECRGPAVFGLLWGPQRSPSALSQAGPLAVFLPLPVLFPRDQSHRREERLGW